jgi:DNA-binding transcriptional regulator WhiA
MPKKALINMKQKYGIKIPDNITFKKPFWSVKKAAKIGGNKTYNKYGVVGGNQRKRKEAWLNWWENKGKNKKEYSFIGKKKKIKRPKLSVELAEFVGIVLGDGNITGYQVTITLNQNETQYVNFVKELIKKLFNIEPNIVHRKDQSVKNIVISSKNLVEFLTKEVGLKKGNKVKQNVAVPKWVFKSNKLQKACLRGLIDTDGCVAIHRYKSNNKYYQYRKVILTNYSSNIIKNGLSILINLKIKARISKNKKRIWIDDTKQVNKFIKIINSNNKRHLDKFNGEVHRIGKVAPC